MKIGTKVVTQTHTKRVTVLELTDEETLELRDFLDPMRPYVQLAQSNRLINILGALREQVRRNEGARLNDASDPQPQINFVQH